MSTFSFAWMRFALGVLALPLFAAPGGAWADAGRAIPDRDVMDIDAMAARIPIYQDLYKKTRDEALACSAKTHPNDATDPAVRMFTRAEVYMTLWGDFYGEDVFRHTGAYLAAVNPQDARDGTDPLLTFYSQESIYGDSHPGQEDQTQMVIRTTEEMGASDYPAVMKLDAYSWAISVLVKYKTQENVPMPSASLAQLPALMDKWRALYGTMVAAKLPHPFLFGRAQFLLCGTQNDEGSLDLAIAEIDRAFNENDAANPVKLALDGDYFTRAAWNARGGGWANSVSNNGWAVFGQRLNQADTILESAYASYPNESEIATTMLTVELGQGQGTDRMELWFQRAVKADPNDYSAYKSKEWYLQPRWFGSVDDIVTFGQQCAATNNWTWKIPMIFPIGVAEASQTNPEVYQNPQIWDQLVKVYGDYLSKYPKASMYRTNFAKHAYDGGHMDVAREQFKILGDDWDRGVVNEADHEAIVARLGL